MYIYIHIHIHVCIYIYIYICLHTHAPTFSYVCIYVYEYIIAILYTTISRPARSPKTRRASNPRSWLRRQAPRTVLGLDIYCGSLNIIIPLKPYTDINRSCQLLDKISENPNDLEFPGSLPNTRTQWISRDINGESLDSVGMCHPCQGFRVAGFRGFVDL